MPARASLLLGHAILRAILRFTLAVPCPDFGRGLSLCPVGWGVRKFSCALQATPGEAGPNEQSRAGGAIPQRSRVGGGAGKLHPGRRQADVFAFDMQRRPPIGRGSPASHVHRRHGQRPQLAGQLLDPGPHVVRRRSHL